MKSRISRQQFVAAGFLGLLSALIRVMPRASAVFAGRAAWLCAVPAFFLLAGFGLFVLSLLKEGKSMGDVFLQALGPAAGRGLLLIYGLAFLFYAGFVLRVGADRLVVTVYPTGGTRFFFSVLLLLCLMAAMGTLRAIGRTAVILRAVMLGVLAMAFVFSLPDLSAKNLGPVKWEDTGNILLGALPLVNVGGIYFCFSFLEGYAAPDSHKGRFYLPWLAMFMLIAALLCVTVVGSFGPVLSLRMSYPFFVMIRNVSLLNLADRIEAFVIVLWIFSDFMLCTLLLRCAHEALRRVFDLPEPEEKPYFDLSGGRWLFLPEAAAVWCTAHFIALDSYGLIPWADRIVPLAMALLMFGGFPLVWLVGRLRKKI